MLQKTILFLINIFYTFFIILVIVLGVTWQTGAGGYWKIYKKTPVQPIDFSHRIHVGKAGIACTFCHQYADRSIHAGVPSMLKCVTCHKKIAVGKPEIKKLMYYWDNKIQIPWVKVHNLPKHVYFSHKRHIKKDFDCSVCHGEVKMMSRIRRVRSLKMGWCVSCHKKYQAPRDCLTCHK